MRRSQTDAEHAEAVARRLAILGAELSALRGDEEPTRLRGEASPAPVTIPVPGRHASRRPRAAWRQAWGERWPWVTGLGPVHVAVVVTIAAIGVGVAAWMTVSARAQPEAVPELRAASTPLVTVPTAPATDGSVASSPSTGSVLPTEGRSEVTVDVAGKVRRPGIVVLPAGSRVVDALEEAGGARRGVDLTSINLARVLVDGEQILVGVDVPAGVGGSLGAPGTVAPAGLVNINTADQVTLETLPGVGPVTAAAIIGWRSEHGGFGSVDELLEVDGIGEATLAKLAPLVTI
ncbi:MAG: ComEA family DNA-binding protein [Nocardioides sp.]|nr:ComEA family DNA-binding protein [Nocardioides sp.]